MCNSLDLTTYAFPVTFADKALDAKPPPHAFRNHEDEAIYHLCTRPRLCCPRAVR